ncbi:DUF2513 domain-containing protein [Brucella anthropi]|uniref:DUF2513 domain-containing protein n=1 Tax=Brucella anthropi TaxID=529 RepID=UPI0032082D42
MKLEIDLMRDLLLHIEESASDPISSLTDIVIPSWSKEQIDYHVLQAQEAGFLQAHIDTMPMPEDPMRIEVHYEVMRLTFAGHEFLSAIRQPKHWKVIKSGAKGLGLASLSAIGSFAQAYAKSQIEKHFGVQI